jgi:hypothetical protein
VRCCLLHSIALHVQCCWHFCSCSVCLEPEAARPHTTNLFERPLQRCGTVSSGLYCAFVRCRTVVLEVSGSVAVDVHMRNVGMLQVYEVRSPAEVCCSISLIWGELRYVFVHRLAVLCCGSPP